MTALASLKDRASTIPWWLLLLEGLVALVFAALLLVAQKQPLDLLIQVAGLYLLVRGVLLIVGLFVDRTTWLAKLVAGILAIIAGILVVQHPTWSGLLIPTTTSLLVGLLGITVGVIGMGQAMAGGGWYYGVLGFLCVILGIPFLFTPMLGALIVPVVLGIAFLIGGLGAVYLALSARKEQVASEA